MQCKVWPFYIKNLNVCTSIISVVEQCLPTSQCYQYNYLVKFNILYKTHPYYAYLLSLSGVMCNQHQGWFDKKE